MTKEERKEQIKERCCLAMALGCGTFALIFPHVMGDRIFDDSMFIEETEEMESAAVEECLIYSGLPDYLNNVDYSTIELPVVVEKAETQVVEEAIEAPEEEYSRWSNEDYERLAHLAYCEAGSQGYECMLYVCSVVINRVNSDRYPDTIEEVINQAGQYSVKGYYMSRTPSESAYYAAEEILTNGSYLPDYVLYQHGNGRAVKGTTVYTVVEGEVFSY